MVDTDGGRDSLGLRSTPRIAAALAFVPFCALAARGPDTPSLHWSLYLGFMAWQGATAATLALSQPVARAKAIPWEEV